MWLGKAVRLVRHPRVGGRAVMQLSVKQSPCASVVRSLPGPHQSSWRSWKARLPPKEQVARSSRAEGAQGLVTEWLGTSLQNCGTPVRFRPRPPRRFPLLKYAHVRASAGRRTPVIGRIGSNPQCQSAQSRWQSGGHPHIRARHAQPRIHGGCGSTHAGYRLLSGRSRVRIPSRRPAPRSSAAEHQHRCAPPHPHPPARSAPRRKHE